MLKKLLVVTVLIAMISGTWYLFLREGDVRASFHLNTVPGTINQSAKLWLNNQTGVSNFRQRSLRQFEHDLESNGSRYHFIWDITMRNDTTSRVRVSVIEPSQSILNRLKTPFIESEIEKLATSKLKDFYEKAREHLEKVRVEIIGETKVDSTFCIYVPVTTTQFGKAGGMMQNYNFISNFIVSNSLEPAGMPIVQVNEWDKQNDELEYHFCYPISFRDSLPNDEILAYKWITPFKAVQANYYGNYITSDRAWYALEEYATKQGIELQAKPLEVFYNNPNIDSEEKNWKAEVFMPLID